MPDNIEHNVMKKNHATQLLSKEIANALTSNHNGSVSVEVHIHRNKIGTVKTIIKKDS